MILLMKNFELISFSGPDELAKTVAAAWLDEIEATNRAGKLHTVALSGGRITQKFFASVIGQAKVRSISFGKVHFFWADERCVPPTDQESNFRMAQELLFLPLNISESQIHRIPGEEVPEVAARKAAAEISGIVLERSEGQPMLDVIFLGLGEDGHVASLFPGESEETSMNPAVFREVLNSPKPPAQRVSLGFPAIASAKQVWMLASGKGKEGALQESLSSNGRTPFARVLRMRSNTKVFSDIPV
jgi:6-phosphogluconolactonase